MNLRLTHTDLMNRLSLRVNADNPNHHLWLNNGTWFIHYVLHPTPITKARVRRSLRTKSLHEARDRRDELFAQLAVNYTAAHQDLESGGGRMARRVQRRRRAGN